MENYQEYLNHVISSRKLGEPDIAKFTIEIDERPEEDMVIQNQTKKLMGRAKCKYPFFTEPIKEPEKKEKLIKVIKKAVVEKPITIQKYGEDEKVIKLKKEIEILKEKIGGIKCKKIQKF